MAGLGSVLYWVGWIVAGLIVAGGGLLYLTEGIMRPERMNTLLGAAVIAFAVWLVGRACRYLTSTTMATNWSNEIWFNLHRFMMVVGGVAFFGAGIGHLFRGIDPALAFQENLKHANATEAVLIIFALVSTGWFTALVPVHLLAFVLRIRIKFYVVPKKRGPYPFGD